MVEREVGAGEHVGAREQRDGDGEERAVGGSEEEKEVDSDEWFTNFSCIMNEVEVEVETDGYHSEELIKILISSDDEDEDVEV